jgi:uncharacterized protein (TIGR04222 family)
MNPFELPGPQFLAVYATLGILVVWAVYVLKQQAEGGEPVNLPSMDPYLIAYLRGGATEAVRLGVAVLVDRQLLAFDPDGTVTRREHVSPAHGRNDLEQAILEQCASAEAPRDLAVNRRLQEIALRSYEPELVRLGLLAESDTRARRVRDAGIAIAILFVVAAIKIAIGVARNRPVSFLVMSLIGFSVVTMVVIRGRRTVLGERVLADLAMLFDALRDRANELRPYSSTSELALLIAVFGLTAVPVSAFPFRHAFTSAADPSASSTSSYGSSCGGSSCGGGGSSCGGGGSSCGGGGGCGGCGSS